SHCEPVVSRLVLVLGYPLAAGVHLCGTSVWDHFLLRPGRGDVYAGGVDGGVLRGQSDPDRTDPPRPGSHAAFARADGNGPAAVGAAQPAGSAQYSDEVLVGQRLPANSAGAVGSDRTRPGAAVRSRCGFRPAVGSGTDEPDHPPILAIDPPAGCEMARKP